MEDRDSASGDQMRTVEKGETWTRGLMKGTGRPLVLEVRWCGSLSLSWSWFLRRIRGNHAAEQRVLCPGDRWL